jgi:hypothetical protein
MKSTVNPYASGALVAEKLVKEWGLTLPIDPFAIAAEFKIAVAAKPASNPGVSGMLVRVGNEFAIAYATHIGNEPFQRYSVAHELGHYFLPGHPQAIFDARGIHESRAQFVSKDHYEMEADGFAAGLLMPRHLFFPALEGAGQGLAAVESLAAQCKTSLHATGIRYAQCTRDLAAVVVSTGDRVDHCFMSEALKGVDGIDWLRKRDLVPRLSATCAFNQDPVNVRTVQRVEETSNLQDWFGGKRRIAIDEDVIGLGNYGRTLTVLYNISVPEHEEEQNEATLIESWTPRFRR